MTWTERNLLDVDDLSAEEVETVMASAADFRAALDRGHADSSALNGHHVALLFAEPSTRTRLSFELAARRLGAQTYLLDPPSSSMVKGESLADTVRNLDAIGFTMLVVRHHRAGAPWVAARHFSGHVLNAGDGWHAHPTQALLDLFTLRRAWVDAEGEADTAHALRGRKIAIVGDVLHSRVARSNVWTLTQAGAEVWLCGPREWISGLESVARALPAGRSMSVTPSLPDALDGADAVMGLRVQKERMKSGVSAHDYERLYQVNARTFAMAKPGAFYLHPGPINEGVEVTRDVCLGPRSLVLEQARNGVPVRMAAMMLVAATGQTDAASRALSSVSR